LNVAYKHERPYLKKKKAPSLVEGFHGLDPPMN